jgi:hypothetical protein
MIEAVHSREAYADTLAASRNIFCISMIHHAVDENNPTTTSGVSYSRAGNAYFGEKKRGLTNTRQTSAYEMKSETRLT